MNPQNISERNKAFRSFLVFFSITIGLVIAAVFSSVQVPIEQNKQLTEQMALVKAERLFTQKFENNMNVVMRLLDSLNKKDAVVTLIDGKIEERLKSMNALIDTDSSLVSDPSLIASKDLYTSIVSNLNQYHAAKKEIRDAANQDKNLSELMQKIQNLNAELNIANQKIAFYQVQFQLGNKN